MMAKDADVLDRTVAFLQKRDGTDKLLKILRYAVKLLLAGNAFSSQPETTKRLKSFESSVGVSRKALRLGKFLQDVNDLRRAPSVLTSEGFLELVANGGEGVYYFVEQFIWLVKAGAIDKRHGPKLQKLSASFELLGYSGSITLKVMQIAELFRRETLVLHSMQHHQQSCRKGTEGNKFEERNGMRDKQQEGQEAAVAVKGNMDRDKDVAALRVLRFKRVLKTLSLIQDISDSVLALADIIDEEHQPWILRHAGFLAAAGLLSAVISAHKNWVSL